jgi:KRAB domain-containing zinc finger protein
MKSYLVQHMWKHRSDKQFNYAQCKRGYNVRDKFKTHLRSHSINPRPFQCDLCPKSYPTKQHIKEYLMAIHSEQNLKCNECDFSTKKKEFFNSHKRRHSNAKPFSCPICKKKFKTKQEIQQHQTVHRTTKDFECKTCGKMFSTQNHNLWS